MPALNYQERFAGLVECGVKLHSIRARRKDGRDPKAGEPIYHFTGMRTKKCRKLRDSTCTKVQEIEIRAYKRRHFGLIIVDGNPIHSLGEQCRLAQADGFESLLDFYQWFKGTHGERFSGLLIHWNPLPS